MRKSFTTSAGLAAAVALGLLPAVAGAAPVCSGTISGSPLRPMASPASVSLVHSIDSSANPDLAKQFVAGLESAGVAIVPQGQGTTTLDLSFMLKGRHKGKYRDLSWMRGVTASASVRSTLQGSQLDATIYARDAASHSLAWTGAIACTVQTDDMDALAEGLGAAIGKTLGKSVPKANL